MKDFFGKALGFILGVFLVFPLLGLASFLIACKDYYWSAIISAGTFFLIMGFSGVACFLAIAMTIILTAVGQQVYKFSIKLIDENMEKKLSKLTEEEKTQRNRGIQIDNIIGRFGGSM